MGGHISHHSYIQYTMSNDSRLYTTEDACLCLCMCIFLYVQYTLLNYFQLRYYSNRSPSLSRDLSKDINHVCTGDGDFSYSVGEMGIASSVTSIVTMTDSIIMYMIFVVVLVFVDFFLMIDCIIFSLSSYSVHWIFFVYLFHLILDQYQDSPSS